MTHRVLHPSKLNLYHRNPRVGDTAAIAGSLRANNQYRPVVVNKGTHTEHPNEVLAGNHTVKAIRDLAQEYPEDPRWQRVDCWIVDVDADRAARIVAADNRTAELGHMDNEALTDLLNSLPDLDGTGFSDEDLSALMFGLEDAPSGSPTTDQGVLDDSDKAAWPIVKLQLPPEWFEKLGQVPGEDHSERVMTLLADWSG